MHFVLAPRLGRAHWKRPRFQLVRVVSVHRSTHTRSGPLERSPYQIGKLAVLTLVALRIGIGWQFYKEGAAKFVDPKPYSAGFFSNAHGPLAPLFHDMIWDAFLAA